MKHLLMTMAAIFAFSIGQSVSASTLYAKWSLTAPRGATDLHFQFTKPNGFSVSFRNFSPFDNGLLDTDPDNSLDLPNERNHVFFHLDTGSSMRGGETVLIEFELSWNDIFNPILTDAWWTRGWDPTNEDNPFGERYPPRIDKGKLTLTSSNPSEPIVVPNLPLPAGLPLLAGGLGAMALVRRFWKSHA